MQEFLAVAAKAGQQAKGTLDPKKSYNTTRTWAKSMVYLDTNILIETAFPDRKRKQQAIDYLKNLNDTTAISMLSVHLMYYYGRKNLYNKVDIIISI